MIDSTRVYEGGELELFQNARNWKRYIADRLRPCLKGDVLEVGAGLGAFTAVLSKRSVKSWRCLEPDPAMAEHLVHFVENANFPFACHVCNGMLADLSRDQVFDTILYIDVLEHIEEDRAELAQAAQLLNPGGFLVVLSPAHQWLYSPFDAAIGHFRRYAVSDAADITPPGLTLASAHYLDSVGLLAMFANKALLRASMPTLRQVLLWDRLMVPLSRLLDQIWFGRLGRSVLFIWRRDA
jgi:SAM-dependent methyltransferase